MTPFFFRRRRDETPKPASEDEVLKAGSDFLRKEKLVERFPFLPPETQQAAKDTALNRFLEILFSYLRR